MKEPLVLSTARDGTLLLADRESGVYQSSDDGVTWKLLFTPDLHPDIPDQTWHVWNAIKVRNIANSCLLTDKIAAAILCY